jgi:hypothetical protein
MIFMNKTILNLEWKEYNMCRIYLCIDIGRYEKKQHIKANFHYYILPPFKIVSNLL